ncbi:hypothetical protein K7X08_005902 [Anisodus acutangulus]|uniref:Uncharacterized protein n=1 Tax=Anisodus acutangulus TaxID=402998 RepID=A0A9Q1R7C2_9SOLA|nr:hypothetical protein K7X08_005902 [Anisodus acutangulus]
MGTNLPEANRTDGRERNMGEGGRTTHFRVQSIVRGCSSRARGEIANIEAQFVIALSIKETTFKALPIQPPVEDPAQASNSEGWPLEKKDNEEALEEIGEQPHEAPTDRNAVKLEKCHRRRGSFQRSACPSLLESSQTLRG